MTQTNYINKRRINSNIKPKIFYSLEFILMLIIVSVLPFGLYISSLVGVMLMFDPTVRYLRISNRKPDRIIKR